jgi:hypothetical protein
MSYHVNISFATSLSSNHVLFVLPERVKIGDYPAEEIGEM